MADDGFFLNIAPADSSTLALAARRHQKQEYRRNNTWKNRREQAKEQVAVSHGGGESSSYQAPYTRDAAGSETATRGAEAKKPSAKADYNAEQPAVVAQNTAASLSHRASKHVISSLFTKNPEIPSLPRYPDEHHEQKVASNAVVDASSFVGAGLDPDIAQYLETKMDITNPTAIQQNAIPAIIGKAAAARNGSTARHGNSDAFDVDAEVHAEHDVFIQAATGSGKTLAYLLPIFHRLVEAGGATPVHSGAPSRDMGTFAIILTPTRELAQQV
ncbi:ATP-dependent RNA helicase dbp7, partial [Coemansia sp. RSA 2399]